MGLVPGEVRAATCKDLGPGPRGSTPVACFSSSKTRFSKKAPEGMDPADSRGRSEHAQCPGHSCERLAGPKLRRREPGPGFGAHLPAPDPTREPQPGSAQWSRLPHLPSVLPALAGKRWEACRGGKRLQVSVPRLSAACCPSGPLGKSVAHSQVLALSLRGANTQGPGPRTRRGVRSQLFLAHTRPSCANTQWERQGLGRSAPGGSSQS